MLSYAVVSLFLRVQRLLKIVAASFPSMLSDSSEALHFLVSKQPDADVALLAMEAFSCITPNIGKIAAGYGLDGMCSFPEVKIAYSLLCVATD